MYVCHNIALTCALQVLDLLGEISIDSRRDLEAAVKDHQEKVGINPASKQFHG